MNIIGFEEYFKAAILIPIVTINNKKYFLFQKRAKNIRQGSEISFPGGQYDKILDKNFKDTAIRETIEETGIKKEKIKNIEYFGTFIDSKLYIECFTANLDIKSINELNHQKEEVEYLFLVETNFFKKNNMKEYSIQTWHSPYIKKYGKKVWLLPSIKLKLPKFYHKPWKKVHKNIYLYESSHGAIWGITAHIIKVFIEKYKE
ncbi:NUDIX domain-containing protein [Hypnocyclicus thermotrophus]|uniref:NUDIX domain-containing protein n=1 Tax=Hypnocyclicus thermotrophus TaxID=1627895 RepID=A0AA46I6H2_9FUSO|nr:NUDIX domain-containing protein [Hypnocyclicus thermotrophus]TDT71786.1 NUDIX domain-containing protein [Hypnocyclicus thermotrophus]